MDQVHFVTLDGNTTGRSSPYFGDIKAAGLFCTTQNEKAVTLDIQARYIVATMPANEIPPGEKIRS